MPWPPKENNHGQILNHQADIKSQEFLIKNKNNNNNNNKKNKTKTKDEVSITTKEDITNNTDKLVDLINEGTAVLKDDLIWKTMSISVGIDGILLFHVYRPKQPTKTTSKQSLKKAEIIRSMNSDYKKHNTDLNTIDTSILVDEFDLRLEYDDFKTKMIKQITKIDSNMVSADIFNKESNKKHIVIDQHIKNQ